MSNVPAAKIWRRKVASFGQRFALRGVEVPRELRETGPSINAVTALQTDVQTKLGKLRGLNVTATCRQKRAALMQTGEQISRSLGMADATQEVKVQTLPAKTRSYWNNKGLLYLGLKQINAAARDIFADSSQQTGMFNMRLLYHKGEGSPAPGAPPATPPQQP